MSTGFHSFSPSNPFNPDSDAGDDHSEHSSTNPPIVPQSDTFDLSHTVFHRRRGAASTSLAQLTDDRTAVKETSTTLSPSNPFTGIKNDFAELGHSIKELLSSSSNIAASGISSFTCNFLRFKDDKGYEEEDGEDALEIDGDVLDFARKVSMRPKVWTEFPIAVEEDFDMSDSQRLHAATIEDLVPALASLRQEISGHMSSGKFWLIYFTLLLPSLNEDDMTLLCSPKIVEAREKLVLYFQNNRNAAAQEEEEDAEGEAEAVENDKSGIEVVDEAASNEGKSSPTETRSLVEVSLSEVEDEEVEDGVLIDRVSGLRITESSRVSSNEWIRLKESKSKKGGSCSNIDGKESENEDLVEWLHVGDEKHK